MYTIVSYKISQNALQHSDMQIFQTSGVSAAVLSPSLVLWVKMSIASAAILLFCWDVSFLSFEVHRKQFWGLVASGISRYTLKK